MDCRPLRLDSPVAFSPRIKALIDKRALEEAEALAKAAALAKPEGQRPGVRVSSQGQEPASGAVGYEHHPRRQRQPYAVRR